MFHCGLVHLHERCRRGTFAFTIAKLFISLICQTHLLWKLTVTRNTDGNFPHDSTGRDIQSRLKHLQFFLSSPSCKIKTRFLKRATQRKQLWCVFNRVLTCPPPPEFKKKKTQKTSINRLMIAYWPFNKREGYKQAAVIWVVSSHRSGGYKHISDKLPLNGGRKQPSAPVQASLTLLPWDKQAALLQQVHLQGGWDQTW